MLTWLQETNDGFILKVHIVPNSSRTQVVGQHGERLKIKIKAPPVDGKANEEILEFVCEKLELKRSQAEIISGQTSKSKNILLKAKSVDADRLVT